MIVFFAVEVTVTVRLRETCLHKPTQKTHNDNEREDGTKRQKLEYGVSNMKKLLDAMANSSTDANGLTTLEVKDDVGELVWKEAKFLLQRECYVKAWTKIKEDLEEKTNTVPVYKITGTPGIGKTAFRFWILLQWVREKVFSEFKTILFSDGVQKVYEITRIENQFTISCVDYDGDVFCGPSKGRFGVFEMPERLPIPDKQLQGMELLILAGSPSRFQGGSEVMKVNSEQGSCLPLWQYDEILKLPLDTFELEATTEEKKKEELRTKFEDFGGVLRLLSFKKQDALCKINEAMKDATIGFIENVLTGKLPSTTTKFVHRLVALDESEGCTFISDMVFKMCVANAVQHERDNIATYVMGLTDQGAKGRFFEAMFYRDFIKKESEMVVKYEVSSQVKVLESLPGSSYTFDDVPTNDILYKPTKANFHGLDFFYIKKVNGPSRSDKQNADLFMLQTTVSDSGHDSLDFHHGDITKLLTNVKQTYTTVKRIVIYILPYKKDSFNVPELKNARLNGDSVCKGWTDPSVKGFERPHPRISDSSSS